MNAPIDMCIEVKKIMTPISIDRKPLIAKITAKNITLSVAFAANCLLAIRIT